ncbi:hypothetical protein LJR230_001892 [Trinickia sp. LjRoot230]|uniref:hypothetical protein n=1 Tax=Trinickia sp. LjRoot230 TaxID=3342288 RepID=UPI003ED04A98
MFAEDVAGAPKHNPGVVLTLLGLLLIVGYYAVHVVPDWLAGAAHGFPAASLDADLVRKLIGGTMVVAAFVANCYLLLRLSVRLQIIVVWIELALLGNI